jgi:hypothetical protein
MELVDRPTKLQHSLQETNSHKDININQLSTPEFTPHEQALDSTHVTKNVLITQKTPTL